MIRFRFFTLASTLALGLGLAGPALAESQPAFGTFGFDTAGMDTSVRPGDDFYTYANGGWLKSTPIPEDKSNYGMFTVLADQAEAQIRAIIEELAASRAEPGSESWKIGTLYADFMNEAAIEQAGLAPARPELDRINAIASQQDLAAAFARMATLSVNQPFEMYVGQDRKAPDVYVPYLGQGGLGLPDRDYYLDDNPNFAAVREKYKQHIANMFRLAGVAEADAMAKAEAIYAVEEAMARVHWSRGDSRDRDKTYNKRTLAQLQAEAPGFDWATFLSAMRLDNQPAFLVAQPSAFTGMAAIIARTPLQTWKDYLTFHYLSGYAGVLPKAFVEEDFDFSGRTLSGIPELKARWKRGVDLVESALGEAVGKLYVQRHFPPEAKAAADRLVQNVILAYGQRIDQLDWMSPETKAKAREKLAKFNPKIGYPSKWRDYTNFEVKPGDVLGNAQRASEFEFWRNVNKLGKPVDRDEWFMTPQTVNAYYYSTNNEIVFPAAILQPPFFDPNADDAVNYGGIGAVIGHELGHGFDDQGSKVNGDGVEMNWWTDQDRTRFDALGNGLSAQYETYCPFTGECVRGKLTLGENLGDLGGLSVAHAAYKLSLGGKDAPVIDGTTGDQRFFLGWAQVWRRAYRDAELRRRLVTDPHSPSQYRTNGIVRNMDAWYKAFNIDKDAGLYLPPEQRIRIW